MQPFIIHLAAGHALFSGTAAIVAGAGLSLVPKKWARAPSRLLGLAGAVIVAFSAAPLPFWFYTLWGILFLLWMISSGGSGRRAKAAKLALLIICGVAVLIELPWHRQPTLPKGPYHTLYVIGDSVTSGIGQGERTWPNLIAGRSTLRVVDLSQAGDRVETAYAEVTKVTEPGALVILEIGGNDLIGSVKTSAADFDRHLDRLLQGVSGSGRQVVMLELPAIPGRNRFGMSQRRLSRRYGVRLVPRRYFVSILAPPENTVDGIHLSQQGQDAMADLFWKIIGPAVVESGDESNHRDTEHAENGHLNHG